MIENLVWFALCIYFEAMGEQQEGQVAVGHVIMNRVEKTGKSMKDVIIKPWQFSWLNQNRPPVKDYDAFIKCVHAAYVCLEERLDGKDLWGADHYFNPALANPSWARDPKKMRFVIEIGGHKFFKAI